MEDLAARAVRALSRHPAPALSLGELRRLVQGGGVTVSEDVLLRALAQAGRSVRILDPWQGPTRSLRDAIERYDTELPWRLDRWAVVHPSVMDDSDGEPMLHGLRRTVAHLGWRVDEHSSTALARWCVLVLEAERIRRAVRASPSSSGERTSATLRPRPEPSWRSRAPRPRPRPRSTPWRGSR